MDTSRINGLQWFHAIDFGEFASSGRFKPGSPQNITLYGTFEFLQSLNLSNASVMDIGTYDGLVAFGSKKLGAKRVVGVDTHFKESFTCAREFLGYSEKEVEYKSGLQISDLEKNFPSSSFDVIVCAGIIYHMLSPMQAFTTTRKLIAEGGYLVMETPYHAGSDKALLLFNGVEHVVNEPYTYFVPTEKALTGMANLAGFQVVATRVLTSPKRITLLLKAVSRAELIEDKNTSPFIVQMLKRDTCDNEFRFSVLEGETRNIANVSQAKKLDAYRDIIAAQERVTFPYHPPVDKLSYGTTRFENQDGNTKVL